MTKKHTCPVWAGYILLHSLRQLIHSPVKICDPFVKPGDKILDVGSAMGFFSIPLALLVGQDGAITSVDIQEGMLKKLSQRAQKAGVDSRITPILCNETSLNLPAERGYDFALAFYMIHECPKPEQTIKEIYDSLKPNGRFLFAEPKLHVSKADFERSVLAATQIGFSVESAPKITGSYGVVLKKVVHEK